MIVSLMDTKGARYFHRVLDSAVDAWVELGWSVVSEDRSSKSLGAQGQHAYLIEWSGEGEPRTP